ncbi:unnamed protein product [Merluccius merluccius]
MGLDLFTGLGTLRDGVGSAIHHVDSTWQQKWPALLDDVGCLTAFTHRPLVNPDVSPVIQPLCRIPLALRDDVTPGKPDLQCQPLCNQCHGHPAHGNTFSSTSVGRSTAVEFTISASWQGHYGHRHLGCTINELLIWCLLASSQIPCSTMLWAHLRVTLQLFWEGHRQWSGRTGQYWTGDVPLI